MKPTSEEEGSATGSGGGGKFQELFAPPRDILFKGTLEQAKHDAQEKCRHVIVNIQCRRVCFDVLES